MAAVLLGRSSSARQHCSGFPDSAAEQVELMRTRQRLSSQGTYRLKGNHMSISMHRALALGLAICGIGLAFAPAYADDDRYSEKSVTCGSQDGHRAECSADLKGYTVRDVDQESRTDCVVGRNWGYTKRGVWVDDGCRATFHFTNARGGNHPRDYSYRDASYRSDAQKSVKCESHDGKRNTCDADLRGYRIQDVREISRTDCDIGRNFGYDDRGVWVDEGCRAQFLFTRVGDNDRH